MKNTRLAEEHIHVNEKLLQTVRYVAAVKGNGSGDNRPLSDEHVRKTPGSQMCVPVTIYTPKSQ